MEGWSGKMCLFLYFQYRLLSVIRTFIRTTFYLILVNSFQFLTWRSLRNIYIFILIVGCGIGSTLHVGHWMAYCTCPGWLWWWRVWWNEDLQGKPKYSEKTCPSDTLSTTNPTCQTWARTLAAAVGRQRLIAWAMARPWEIYRHLSSLYMLHTD
jgi:hypothetical protein